MNENRKNKTLTILVVFTSLAIVVAVLSPTLRAWMVKPDIERARSDVRRLHDAVMDYWNAYRIYSVELERQKSENENEDGWRDDAMSRATVRALRGDSTGAVPNPGGMVFLKGAAGENGGAFLDPWGTQYIIKMDLNNSGRVSYYAATWDQENIDARVLVISYGPNGIQDDPGKPDGDDLLSYSMK